MSVKIRMRRMGNKNKPFFRIVVCDSRAKHEGRYLELLGWYDPKSAEKINYKLDLVRVDYWKSKGAEVTPTVGNLVRRLRRAQAAEPAVS